MIPEVDEALVPFVTTEQMVEVDRAMIEDYRILLIQMMENAGRNLAHLARVRFLSGEPKGKRVAILAGAVRDRLPLAFFGGIGAVLALMGGAAELTVFVNFALTGKTTPYQSFTILGAIFLILGAFSFLIALLADMLGRMRETQETLLYLEKRLYYDDLARQHSRPDGS